MKSGYLKRFVYVLLACIVLGGQGGAWALSDAQRKVFQENIRYYNVDSGCSATATTTTEKAAAPGPIYILGDSITALSKSTYLDKFSKSAGWDATVEGLTSRHIVDSPPTPGGLAQLTQDKQVVGKANAIVVALGTNDTGYDEGKIRSDVQQVMANAEQYSKDSTPIFWVNVMDATHDADSQKTNATIQSAVGNDGTVIDWYSTARSKADIASFNEGVHPTKQKDIDLLVNLVYSSVTSASKNSDSTSAIDNNDSGTACCDATGSTNLTGKDNEEKTWNYFKGKGLSDEQVAGIMGNMQQESSFDPQRIQSGGDSKNPADAGSAGWGLIQWTPGSKATEDLPQSGVSGPIYELSTQLDLVWQHMHNHPVVTQSFSLDDFKSINNEQVAATYFLTHIEGGTDPNQVREKNATSILHDYQGRSGQASPSNSSLGGGCSTSTASPDCQSATGNAVILCEAKKYDPVNYVWGGGHAGGAAYHEACPSIKASDTSCGLDCSGLVSVAVYDAFKNHATWDTVGIASDTLNWKSVSSGDIQPGDMIEPDAGHVEIIDHVSGSSIYTFGAHTSNTIQPKQVGPAKYTQSSSYHYYRYTGQGATS